MRTKSILEEQKKKTGAGGGKDIYVNIILDVCINLTWNVIISEFNDNISFYDK